MAVPPSTTPEELLGQLILARTPYDSMTLPTGWENSIQWDGQRVFWNFRDADRRVAKSLRIPVTITYHNPATGQDEAYRDWLLIGYEGGSGE